MKYTAAVSITGKAMRIFRFLSSRLFDLQVPILGHIFLFEQVDGKIIGKPADVISGSQGNISLRQFFLLLRQLIRMAHVPFIKHDDYAMSPFPIGDERL